MNKKRPFTDQQLIQIGKDIGLINEWRVNRTMMNLLKLGIIKIKPIKLGVSS